ncbi:MAG: MotA/TolQ/ExbB proton channel family protein [Planctomycetota bacterium]|nr:MotA/TolQ/ExbB proton channel family protein [Planctomycetota bacterium]
MKHTRIRITVLAVVLTVIAISGAAYAENAAETEGALTAWEVVTRGGWVMWPLALLSLAAVGIAFHVFLILDPKAIIPHETVASISELIANKRYSEAGDYAARQDSVAARIFSAGLSVRAYGAEKVSEFLTNAGKREVGNIKRRIAMLGHIGQVAPLFGLLGTVIGMIQAFRVVSLSDDAIERAQESYLLASAIWQAMVTTAAGLIVGIFALLLYYYFSGRLQKMASELESETEKFALALFAQDKLHEEKTGSP